MAFASGCYPPASFHATDGLQVAELSGLEYDPNSCRSPSSAIDETQLLDFDYQDGLNRECFYARVVYRTWRSWKFSACSNSAKVGDRNKCPMESCNARFQDLDPLLIHLEIECKALKSHADSVCTRARSFHVPTATSVPPTATESGLTQPRCSQCHSTWCRAKSLFKNNKTLGLRRINSLHESLKKRRKTSPPEAPTDHLGGFPSRASSTTSSVPPPYSKSELAAGASSLELDDGYPLDSRGFVHERQAPWFMGPVEVHAVQRVLELDSVPTMELDSVPTMELDSVPRSQPVELPDSESAPRYHNHSSQVNCDVRDTPSKSFTSVSDMSATTASSRGRDSLLSVYSRPTASSWSTTMSLPPICTTTPVEPQGPIFTDVLTMSPVDTDNGESMEVSYDFDSLLYGEPVAGPRSVAVSPVTDNGHKRDISSEPLSGGSGAATTPMVLSPLDENNRHISSEQQMAASSGGADKTMELFHIDVNNRDSPSELPDYSNPGETRHIQDFPRVATVQSSPVRKDNGNFSRPVLSSNSQWTTGTAAGTRDVAPGLSYKYIPTSRASDTFTSFAQASLIQQSPTVRKTSHPPPIQQDAIVRNTSPAPLQASTASATMSASYLTSATLPTFVSPMTFPQVTGSSSAMANNTFVDMLESLKLRLSGFRKAQPNHCRLSPTHGAVYAESILMPDIKDEQILLGGLDFLEVWLKDVDVPEDHFTRTTISKFCFAYLAMAMVDDHIRGLVQESFLRDLRADFAGIVENERGSEVTDGESISLTWRFTNTASAYLRALNHYVPTSHAGRDEAGYRRRFEVFETMKNYLHQNPSPRRPSEPAAATTTQSPGPRPAAAAQAPQPAPTASQTQRKPREPVAAAANLPGPRPAAPATPPALAPQPAPAPAPTANQTPRKRRRRRSDKPVETCCEPCEYFPDPGKAQQKKLDKHWRTPKHWRKLESLGLVTAASTPADAAGDTPSSAGTTTPGSVVPEVTRYPCTMRLLDGTPCRVTCSRRDNLKNHMKKQPHLREPEPEPEEEQQQDLSAFNGNSNVNGRLDFGTSAYGNDYEDDEVQQQDLVFNGNVNGRHLDFGTYGNDYYGDDEDDDDGYGNGNDNGNGNGNVINGRLDFGAYGNDYYEDNEDDDGYSPTHHVKRAKYSQVQEEEDEEVLFADENERPYGGRRLHYDSDGEPIPTTRSYTAGSSYSRLFSGFQTTSPAGQERFLYE